MTAAELLNRFRALQTVIARFETARNVLQWDMETAMPPAGSSARAETTAAIDKLIHERSTGAEYRDLLWGLKARAAELSPLDARNVLRCLTIYDRKSRLKPDFVAALSELTGSAHHVWVEARKASDFAAFRPTLEKIVAMKREQADMLGWEDTRYDALLEDYEPGARTTDLRRVLGELRAFLTPFVGRIVATGVKFPPLAIPMRLDEQQALCRQVAEAMGFDFKAGALATVAHPMCGRMHPGDVRISTRYDEKDLLYSLGSVIHETGHALYEQGLPAEWYGTPLGDAISMGVHESQSRLWENIVGRSLPFCQWLAREIYPFWGASETDELFGMLNAVRPSLIRTESDEVTYNLHICLRFELELDLIEGRLDVKDLPEAWNANMKEYLGVTVPDDAHGVLQDVHWSAGYLGYFPTYALGNLMAAQFDAKATHDLAHAPIEISVGNFQPLLAWLRAHIHRKGGTRTADELLREVTGSSLDPSHFIGYLERKFRGIYGV